MCSIYYAGTKLHEFMDSLAVEDDGAWAYPETDLRPTDQVPATIEQNHQLHLKAFRWGLIPYWSTDIKVGVRMFNARSETLEEKTAFQESFHERRCLLPMDGFYEYDDQFRYRITRADGEAMAVAGLWSVNKKIDGVIESCTLITCEPNEAMARVHNRMPAILGRAEFEQWLDPAIKDPAALLDLLKPVESGELVIEKVGERKTPKKKPVTGSLFE